MSSRIFNKLFNDIKETQIVIMAGGLGKRMGLDTPKPLLKVAGKTLIDRCIEYYKANGFEKIIIILGYKADEIEKHIIQTHPEIKISRDPFDPSIKPVGKAKALKHALDLGVIDSSKRAIVTFPDDIFLDPYLPLKLLMHHFQGRNLYRIWATAVFASPTNYPYGVARISPEGLVKEFKEKPRINIPTSIGLYLFEPQALKLFYNVNLEAPYAIEFEHSIIPRLAKEKKLYALIIHGDLWIPVNTQKDLQKAENLLKNNYKKLF